MSRDPSPRLLVLLTLVSSIFGAESLVAQDRGFREAARLPLDVAVARQLETGWDYLIEQDYERGLPFLEQLRERSGDRLVRVVDPGGDGPRANRYVAVADYIRYMLSQLPPAGREAYRNIHDEPARRRWKDARETLAVPELMRIRERAFLSSIGDDATLLLGDLMFERGRISFAISLWRELLPHEGPDPQSTPKEVEPMGIADPSGLPFGSIRHPDSEIGPAEIRSRLVVGLLAIGRRSEAADEFERLRVESPEATGTLFGRQGVFVSLVDEIRSNADIWDLPPIGTDFPTYGGSLARSVRVPQPETIGRKSWTWPVGPNPLPGIRPDTVRNYRSVWTTPAIVGDAVVYSDGTAIYGHHLATGLSLFDPYSLAESSFAPSSLRLAPDLPSRPDYPIQPTVGANFRTVTIADGWAYATLGSGVTGRAPTELRRDRSLLMRASIADPDRAVGDSWPIDCEDLCGPDWAFVGSPSVEGNHLWIAIQKGQPNIEREVVCVDLAAGTLRWRQPVLAAVSPVGTRINLVSGSLLTLGPDRIFDVSHHGAVSAFDRRTGQPVWAVTYESRNDSLEERGDPRRFAPLPGLLANGILYAKPNDSDHLFAIDARSGEVLWSRRLPDTIRHLLGVGDGRLIASGNSVWGLDPMTGQVMWGAPRTVAEAFGFGRGLLVDGEVWFPTRHAIERRSLKNGRPTSPPIRLDVRGGMGGDLLLVNDRLLIAEPERIVLYDPSPWWGPPPGEVTLRVKSGRTVLERIRGR